MSHTPYNIIIQHITSIWSTNLIRVLIENKVFDTVASSPPLGSHDIASACSLHPDIMHRSLLAARSLGFFELTPEKKWALTELGACLTVDHPTKFRDIYLFETSITHNKLWMNFGHTLKTSEPPVQSTFPQFKNSYFELLQLPGHLELFQKAMGGYSYKDWNDVVASGCVFPSEGTIADIGAGNGFLIKKVISMQPNLKGVYFELPQVCATLQEELALSSHLTVVPGDFFQSVPTYDAYIIKNVLHDWDDENCLKILSNIRKASLEKSSPLYIVEWITKPGPLESFCLLLDLHMALVNKGIQRTIAHWHDLLNKAGYTIKKRYEAPGSSLEVLVVVPVV